MMCTASVARRGPVRKATPSALACEESPVSLPEIEAYNRPQEFPRRRFLGAHSGHRPVAATAHGPSLAPAPSVVGRWRWRWTSSPPWRPARTLRPRLAPAHPLISGGLITAIHLSIAGLPRSRVGIITRMPTHETRACRAACGLGPWTVSYHRAGEVVSFKYANRVGSGIAAFLAVRTASRRSVD